MNRFRLLPCLLLPLAAAVVSFGALTPSRAADVVDSAEESNTAKNLARMNCGAQIECITPDGRSVQVADMRDREQAPAALILDNTLSCPLQEGRTTFIIKLASVSQLDRFNFVNENAAAAGQLKIAVSNYQLPAASNKWVEVAGEVSFAHKRFFNLSLLGVEARYVRLSFEVAKPGQIAALGLYGGQSLEAFSKNNRHLLRDGNGGSHLLQVGHKKGNRPLEEAINFDFANLYAHGHVVYVSSGMAQGAPRMIDDDTSTSFRFAATDLHPTTVVELEQRPEIHRITAVYQMEPGRLDVYLLNELQANPGDLSKAKRVASVEDRDEQGKASVNFDPQDARYVALRWTPAGERHDGKAFEIAEINAYGEVALSMLNFSAFPEIASIAPSLEPPAASIGIPFVPEVSP